MGLLRTALALLAWFFAAAAVLAIVLGLVSLRSPWWSNATGSGFQLHRWVLTVRWYPTGVLGGVPPGWRSGPQDEASVRMSVAGRLRAREQSRWVYDIVTAYDWPPAPGTTGEIGGLVKVRLPRAALASAATAGLLLLTRRLRWPRRGCCPTCGYSLAGLPSGTACPECGHAKTTPSTR
jgi:hypothetical protein